MVTLLNPPVLYEVLANTESHSLWLNRDSYKEFSDSKYFIEAVIDVLENFSILKNSEEIQKVLLNILMYGEAKLISHSSIKTLEEIKEALDQDKCIPSFIK